MFQYCYLMGRTAVKLRAAVVSLVYRKSLRLSAASRRRFPAGDVANFVSVDAQRLLDR